MTQYPRNSGRQCAILALPSQGRGSGEAGDELATRERGLETGESPAPAEVSFVQSRACAAATGPDSPDRFGLACAALTLSESGSGWPGTSVTGRISGPAQRLPSGEEVGAADVESDPVGHALGRCARA